MKDKCTDRTTTSGSSSGDTEGKTKSKPVEHKCGEKKCQHENAIVAHYNLVCVTEGIF